MSQQQYSLDHIPTLFVATKSELDLAQQRHEVQPDVYCRRLSLQVPVAVSVKTSQMADVFNAICDIAIHPYVVYFPHKAKIYVTPVTDRRQFLVVPTICRQPDAYVCISPCRHSLVDLRRDYC